MVLRSISANGQVFALVLMAQIRCYALVAVKLALLYNRSTKNIFILLCGG